MGGSRSKFLEKEIGVVKHGRRISYRLCNTRSKCSGSEGDLLSKSWGLDDYRPRSIQKPHPPTNHVTTCNRRRDRR